MCDRYSGYASFYGGTPVSSWDRDRGFNSLENQIQQQYGRRVGQTRCWGSMSEGGGVSGAGDNCKTNLIVNYLPQTMTEKDLYAMFMTIGPIESCRVMKDFKTGYSYGFGFVNFTREEDAARAIDTFNGYQLRNKRLKVSYARPSGDDIKDTNLYVTNLPRAITEEQLETIFGKYGRIVQKHILRDKSNGTPRGVAFVRFDKREEAQEAIAALNNVIPEGGTEPLTVKSCGRSADAAIARLQPACSRSHSRSRLHSDMSVEYGPETAYGRFAPVNSTIPGPGPGLSSRSGSRGRLHSDSLDSEWSTQYPQTTKGRIGFASLPTRGLNSHAGSRAQLYSDSLCTEREARALAQVQAVGRRSLPTPGLRSRAGSHARLNHGDSLNADSDPLTSLRQFSSLPVTGSLPGSGFNSRSGSRTRFYSDYLNADLGPSALTRLVSASLPTGSLPAASSLPASGLNSRSNSRSRLHDMNAEWGVDSGACAAAAAGGVGVAGVGAGALVRFGSATLPSYGQASRTRLNSDTLVAEEHGKQKAAYYAGWAAGFHHNRGDFAWPCGNCMMDPWDKIPPLGGSYPTTPRNGCRPGACANTRMYPNYMPGKGTPRASRGRNLPWAPGFGAEERFKGQRCRTGPAPYW